MTVNGVRVSDPGSKADPDTDEVCVNGTPIGSQQQLAYLVLNKPVGYVTTVSDRHAKQTVMDLVKGASVRVYPVGRLDADSAGVLLLTNDGDLTFALTHPSHEVPRSYRVLVRGEVSSFAATDLRTGIMLDDGLTAPAVVEWVEYQPDHNITVIDVTIREGRNRQVRRMLDAVGHPVLALTRTAFGPITTEGLAPGTWRKLRAAEIAALKAAVCPVPPPEAG